jgi:hypothetical protein
MSLQQIKKNSVWHLHGRVDQHAHVYRCERHGRLRAGRTQAGVVVPGSTLPGLQLVAVAGLIREQRAGSRARLRLTVRVLPGSSPRTRTVRTCFLLRARSTSLYVILCAAARIQNIR